MVKSYEKIDSLTCKKSSGYRLNSAKGAKLASTFLRTLLTFTNAKAWKVLGAPAFAALSSGMHQLCANVMGHLVTNAGLLKKIKSFLLTGVASSSGVVLKKTALAGMVNISILLVCFLPHI